MTTFQPLPFILSFRTPFEREGVDPFSAEGVRYDPVQEIWLNSDDSPLWANRSRLPPTPMMTAGHYIKAGYTPSGKYKPQTYVPPKLDRRAGK
jgi:hypothetical protein